MEVFGTCAKKLRPKADTMFLLGSIVSRTFKVPFGGVKQQIRTGGLLVVPNENMSTTKGRDGVTCLSVRVQEVTETDILRSRDIEGYIRSLFSHFLESSISKPVFVGP
jgi:hypothetical protein